jgi:septal ring factor EnvC (AmiA/AmiB activator)
VLKDSPGGVEVIASGNHAANAKTRLSNTMTVTSTSTTVAAPIPCQSGCKQTKADFQSLSTALQNGDLTGAKAAFAQLQKDNPRLAQSLNSSSSDASSSGNSRTADLQSLGSALQSGDLSGAQQALAKVQQDAPAQGSGHAHHHHHGDAAAATATDDTATATTSSGAGSLLNVTA